MKNEDIDKALENLDKWETVLLGGLDMAGEAVTASLDEAVRMVSEAIVNIFSKANDSVNKQRKPKPNVNDEFTKIMDGFFKSQQAEPAVAEQRDGNEVYDAVLNAEGISAKATAMWVKDRDGKRLMEKSGMLKSVHNYILLGKNYNDAVVESARNGSPS
jgi:hypothetical protein